MGPTIEESRGGPTAAYCHDLSTQVRQEVGRPGWISAMEAALEPSIPVSATSMTWPSNRRDLPSGRSRLNSGGIRPAGPDGTTSSVRVMRTAGAQAHDPTLMLAIHGAGIKEWAVVTHTDCGVARAADNIGALVATMHRAGVRDAAVAQLGEPVEEKLSEFLALFVEPKEAVRREVERIKALPIVGPDVVVHGLCLRLDDGVLELVVDGDRVAMGLR